MILPSAGLSSVGYNKRLCFSLSPIPSMPRGSGSLFGETDLAFRQAFALCPSSPEVLSRYVEWLLSIRGPNEAVLRELPILHDHPIVLRLAQEGSNRVDDALLLTETVLKLDPQNAKAQEIWKSLNRRSQPQPGHAGDTTNILAEPGKADGHQ